VNTSGPSDLRRRNFLIRFWQGASALAAAPFFRPLAGQNVAAADSNFHLHPAYRTEAPLDALLRKTDASLDDFVTEKYHDRIAAILARWTAELVDSPGRTQAIKNVLASGFLGCSMRPVESRVVRPGPALEVRQISFPSQATLPADAFLREWKSNLAGWSAVVNAELQVTRIVARGSNAIETRVRYELVGSGPDFHREQRVGFWDLEWEAASTGEYRLRRWLGSGETRSRSAQPWYADIGPQAFERAPSYSNQLAYGVDHWRSVLDGASGIDIYGHNGVSVGDIDNDGFDDLYVCQPAGLPNRLYRNRGDGTFEDITESSGVGVLENTACALFADFDNDGRQDLVVVRANGPVLFLNQGGG